MKYPERNFEALFRGNLNNKIRNSDDVDSSNVVQVVLDEMADFSYGNECIHVSVVNGGFKVHTAISVFETGMVKFVIEGCDGPKEMDEGQVRHMIRELYFTIKNLYHTDIHHPQDADVGPNCLSHGDENFSVVRADTLREAVDETFKMIIRKCESGLERYSRNVSGVDGIIDMSMYNILTGFLAFGRNFLNIFRDVLGNDYEKYSESLRSCSDSLRSMDHVMHNLKSMQTSKTAESINIRMMWLSIISISVGFFAGSIMLQAILDADVGVEIIQYSVIIAATVIGILCVLALLSPWIWARIRRQSRVLNRCYRIQSCLISFVYNFPRSQEYAFDAWASKLVFMFFDR